MSRTNRLPALSVSRARNSDQHMVGVLAKALKLLQAIQTSQSGLGLKTVSELTGINKTTAYRMLSHLENEGYVFRNESGAYLIGAKLRQFGAGTAHQLSLREVSRTYLRELWKTTGETVNLGVLEGREVLYVDVIESRFEFRLVSRVGMRRPLYSTALGKALVAFMSQEELDEILSVLTFQAITPHTITTLAQLSNELEAVRRQGFSVDQEESVLGARCIAAPILNSSSAAVAAVSLSGPITRVSEEKISLFASSVREAASQIAARMGFTASSAPLR